MGAIRRAGIAYFVEQPVKKSKNAAG